MPGGCFNFGLTRTKTKSSEAKTKSSETKTKFKISNKDKDKDHSENIQPKASNLIDEYHDRLEDHLLFDDNDINNNSDLSETSSPLALSPNCDPDQPTNIKRFLNQDFYKIRSKSRPFQDNKFLPFISSIVESYESPLFTSLSSR